MSSEQIIELIGVAIVPIIILVIGLIFKKNPPKKINSTVGYRTKNSMKSQEAWDYANKALAESWVKLGGIMLIVSIIIGLIIAMLAPKILAILIPIILIVQVILLILPVFSIEKKLKEL